jgi:carboxypeptidase Q
MFRQKNISVILLVALVLPGFALGQPAGAKTDDAIARIKDEGMNRSQAMKTIRYLTDVIGPRLTNSKRRR